MESICKFVQLAFQICQQIKPKFSFPRTQVNLLLLVAYTDNLTVHIMQQTTPMLTTVMNSGIKSTTTHRGLNHGFHLQFFSLRLCDFSIENFTSVCSTNGTQKKLYS